MADSLTQLQDHLDDLLTQMYASLDYIYKRAPYGQIPGQPSQAPEAPKHLEGTNGAAATNGEAAEGQTREEGPPIPADPKAFDAALHDLARDLVLQEQSIEYIIKSLPGIGNSQADQERRMKELEQELRTVEEERKKKETEREAMVDLLGEVIGKVKRVP